MLSQAEIHFQDAVPLTDESEIPPDALSVSEDVILKTVGFYQPFNRNSNGENKKPKHFNGVLRSKNIVVCQPIFELLTRKLYPNRHPLTFSFGSTFLRNPRTILLANLELDRVPEPLSFHQYRERLYACSDKTIGLLNRDNVYVPVDHQASIPERWRILQRKAPLMTEEALRLIRKGSLCNTHGQYLVESYLRRLPILSSNYREVITAAEMLGIVYKRKTCGDGLICLYRN